LKSCISIKKKEPRLRKAGEEIFAGFKENNIIRATDKNMWEE